MDATTIELPDPPIYAIGAELGRDRGSGISSEMPIVCVIDAPAFLARLDDRRVSHGGLIHRLESGPDLMDSAQPRFAHRA
jgi:hypothetical protein